ncbi:MAG: hypothetical protein HOP11_07965 [Saprospiraceae bacterium]|nr:hypothetical protein [Saprospiraceae bacterium]
MDQQDQFVVRDGRCYRVITSGCVTGRNICLDCEGKDKLFRYEVETDCASCGNCEDYE